MSKELKNNQETIPKLGGQRHLKPGEKISQDLLNELKKINQTYTDNSNFANYVEAIERLFGVAPMNITEDSNRFLGGFIEGEASINVSAKKLTTAKFGLVLDPEFSITQHVNGVKTLVLALRTFKTGRISFKSGSNATMVFKIDNRKSLEQKIVPFFHKYVTPFGSPIKVKRLDNFFKLLQLFNEKKHTNLESFIHEMLPIWHEMRMQTGQSNESFKSLEAAQDFVREFWRNNSEK